MNITFRKAKEQELMSIYSIYKRVINRMQENGIEQWDELYPNPAVIAADIDKEDLYAGEIDGEIVCVFALNTECEDDYNNVSWKYPDAPFVVMHRLAVNPLYHRKGIARAAMKFIEETAKEQGAKTVRLDTFCKNTLAKSLYESLGYTVLGYTYWRKGKFQIMEKTL